MRNETIIVNGKKLKWLFVERGFKIPSFNYATTTEKVPGRPGTIKKSRELDGYEFDIPLIVRNDYLAGRKTHDDILNEVVKFFDYEEPVKLQFSTKGWYWNAYFDGPFEIASNNDGFITFNVQVVLTDPYKYAIEGSQNTAISDAVSVVNSGTADTPVIVEARALQNSNYYMISKGDEDYFMIGDDDLDKPLKDYSPLILEDEARSFSGWNKQNTIDFTDNQTGGKVGGSFSQSSSKESFILNNDSVSGSGWNGAMYKRSFSKQAQDFTTTVKIGVGQKNKGAVRFAQYIYGSDNRVIASIGYTNPNAKQAIGTIIVTLFDQSGNQQTIYKYKNNPRLYKLDDFVVYIRLTRKDNVFTVKSWKYKEFPYPLRKKAFDEHERQFVDGGNFYKRPVASLSLYSAKNGSNNVMPLYIFGTYTRELLPRPTNARDMIIKKGDLITIDMATKNVLVNEESFLSEKTFGSNYFNVDKGHTELVINPPDIFDTTVKWQDRYL
ncbi:TPA: phage tail family protein [Staphylococcus pseudintermedius]|uniref:phage tail domain-containing protein n=1 Tax=Staphylococcus pseudintermedius TaxID=283734 RepID=UPI00111F0B15|nr:phage tail domain-containing protein [Staphylococcus pseudintermedius]EGQ4170121.1 phage tail protein [Staphylococcus pseudintermedius]EII6275898.1 phage tail family protein [Staphylococcus pseudintermedius]EJA1891847.1 phage tail family protein [Staphylococcus pseudintermedius]EKH7758459.1 phage tail family protein [Staphylococcus pseudintermedius]MDK3849209.1 phage tail family protein [Staphylococcus pseudintermedius]